MDMLNSSNNFSVFIIDFAKEYCSSLKQSEIILCSCDRFFYISGSGYKEIKFIPPSFNSVVQ